MKIVLVVLFIFPINVWSFTKDFQSYLQKNYPHLLDHKPSFGGINQKVSTRTPIILIHGNSDMAITKDFPKNSDKWGWNNLIQELLINGYRSSEIYAITWGDMDEDLAYAQYHSYKSLKRIRDFILAVKNYTGKEHVNIITHSMGVTLTRKSITGGWGNDLLHFPNSYNLGEPLSFIKTFVAIAGANGGLSKCLAYVHLPTCGLTNGLHPYSRLIRGLKEQKVLAEKIYTICAKHDHLVNQNTCQLSMETDSFYFEDKKFNHFTIKTMNSKFIKELL